MSTLLDALIKIQKDLKLNDDKFAALIGISPSGLSRIKNSKRGIGISTAYQLYRKFPELLDIVFPKEIEK